MSKHNLTREEYQRLYPDAPLCSQGYAEERSSQTKKFFKSPEAREKLSKAQKKRFEDSEVRRRHSKRMKEMFQRPELRKKHRESVIRSWTPERREKLSKIIKFQWATDKERKRKLSEATKERWKLYGEQRTKRIMEISQLPETRDKMRAGQKKLTEILRELAEKYASEGLRAIPLHHGFPVPDLILLKENKVIAIEVGKRRSQKYGGIPYYDDVLWLRKPKKYGE